MEPRHLDDEVTWLAPASTAVDTGAAPTCGQYEGGSLRIVHIETSGFAVPTSSYTAALPSVETAQLIAMLKFQRCSNTSLILAPVYYMHADGWARDYSHIPEIREGAVSSNMGHTGRSGEQYKLEVIHLRHFNIEICRSAHFCFVPNL